MINSTLKEFNDLLSSKQAVPGGGGASALAGSLSACLGEMVTNLTAGKKKYQEYESEIQDIMKKTDLLRIALLECINKDAEAFEPLSKAYAKDKNDQDYQEVMEKCLKDAANPPYEMMELISEVVDLDERLAIIGSKLAISDVATSVMLAHGALYGAYTNVIVNTRLMKDIDYKNTLEKKANELLNCYAQKAITIYNKVMERLNG